MPDLRKSCKVSAGVAVPVEKDLDFPAQSRQCSASALKRSLEYLEMQDRYQDSFSSLHAWRSQEHRENAGRLFHPGTRWSVSAQGEGK